MSMTEGIQLPLEMDVKSLNGAFASMDAALSVLNSINKTVGDISGKMSGVGSKMKKEFSEGGKGAESLLDKLGKIGLAIDGVKGIFGTVASTVGPILEEGLARENAQNIFGKLLGDPKEGAEYAKQLREHVLSGIYGNGKVNDAAQQMLAFGVDDSLGKGSSLKVLSAIGDIAMGDANKLNSLSLAFAQMTSLGKLQTQDWKQMIGQGFNPLNEIAKKTKESMAQLQDRMSKGNITAKEVMDAFISATSKGGQFNGVMQDQMKGIGGAMKAIDATLAEIRANLYATFAPLAESVLPLVVSLMQQFADIVVELPPVLESLAVISGTLGAIYGAHIALLKIRWLWENRLWLVLKLNVYWTKLLGYVTKVTFGGWVLIFSAIISLITSVVRHWGYLKKAFTDGGILKGILAIGKVILDAILAPIQSLLELLSNIPGLGHLAGKGANYLKELRANLFGEGITPGTEGDGAMGGKNGGNNNRSTAMAKGTTAVATGGTRNTSITINLGSLVHQISYNGGIEKNTRETTQDLQNALLRVLSAASSTTE